MFAGRFCSLAPLPEPQSPFPQLLRIVTKGGGTVQVTYVIVFVSDMKQSVSFYRDVVGLPLKFESPVWTEFATEGATLALHASDGLHATEEDHEDPQAGACRPGLSVPDLDEFHDKMVERGVRCVQQPKEIFGVRPAQYVDPDGLAISVAEEKRGS